jgi:serine/threonine protein kinase
LGLARRLSEPADPLDGTQPLAEGRAAGLTQDGTALGTLAYMSPEQAAGRLDLVGAHSDIYGLGATLYCLLTGQAPFTGSAGQDVLRRVRQGAFPPPEDVNPEVPAPLAAICRKAMSLKPQDRYPTALALAEDVENFLADEPVTAYREPLLTRLARWGRQHVVLVTVTGLLLALATILFPFLLLLFHLVGGGNGQ